MRTNGQLVNDYLDHLFFAPQTLAYLIQPTDTISAGQRLIQPIEWQLIERQINRTYMLLLMINVLVSLPAGGVKSRIILRVNEVMEREG